MCVVSGHVVPTLDREKLTEMITNSPGANLCIFTGDRILIHRGEGESTSILPEGVAKSVKKVHNEKIFDQMLEALRVEFNNGNFATLFMNLGVADPIDDEDLKEFQASCLMLHDL